MQTDTLAYDTLSYDTLDSRPLPKWLIDQKSGLTTIQPEKIVMREDNSLKISFVVTGIFIFVFVTLVTLYFIRKHKKQA
jgi:heme/copper-type cytochrome/quinol oxidase subunit 2